MIILGISCYYHDSAAALIRDGKVVAAAEEERFSRIKHDSSFPLHAVAFCLKDQELSVQDIDYISFYEKPFLKFERLLSQHLACFPKSYKTFLQSIPTWTTEKLRIIKVIRKKLKYRGDVLFVEHHMAHAASSFLTSPFEEAAIVTIDGVGEWATTSYGYGKGSDLQLLKEIHFPYSLGLLYSTVTAYLGFSVNNSEYKVMGLAAYGDLNKATNKYYSKLKEVIHTRDDGSFALDLRYFTFHFKDRMPSERLCALLGGPVRKESEDINKRHKDIAAAVQMVYEETFFELLKSVYAEAKLKNLVLAGGCALNSVANGKVLSKTPFENIWIQPNASDGGGSIGAALFTYNVLEKKPRTISTQHAYLGPEFSRKEIKDYLDSSEITYIELSDHDEIVSKTVELLSSNKVIGWFQGRMEWGPRALGNRSILANPCNPKAQELLNSKVKHRERFRPFAPVVCSEDAEKFFECDTPVPDPTDFMLMVYPIKKKWHKVIPSVTHVDGSGRLQTVKREQNPLYYDIIKEFGKKTDVPVLINTSFNIRGEPIVCIPFHAYKCMMGTGIDYLVLGSFLIKRKDNPRHMWDSEQYAQD
ncbi:carbamoyltransferase [Patescibacteria group bacterium]|nr:carbamoyltransferase [Patescibacteria group bacterium]